MIYVVFKGGPVMKKERYESPKVQFQELFLFEGVADVCWGFHQADMHIFYDADHDDTYDEGEVMLFEHTFVPSEGGHGEGCANVEVAINQAMASIRQAFIEKGYGKYWNESVQSAILSHENAGASSGVYIPVHS